MERMNDIDLGHVLGVSAVEHGAVQRWGRDYARLQMLVAPSEVYAETAFD